MLRDILHYTKEDIRKLALMELQLAIHYAVETYSRRDVLFIMKAIYGGGKPSDQGDIAVSISHPDIEKYIKEQYENEAREREK